MRTRRHHGSVRAPSLPCALTAIGGALALAWCVPLAAAAAPVVPSSSGVISSLSDTTELGPSASTTPVDGTLVSSPVVTVEPASAAPGESITLTISGFDARTVTAAICGNEARRGSGDCDMLSSVGVVLDPSGGPTVAVIPVAAPPSPCPCVVRVATADFGQIAVTDVEVVGHEIAETVDSAQQTGGLAAAVDARRVEGGFTDRLRAGMGGSTEYEVTVTVSNTTSAPIDDVTVVGSFGRSETEFLGELLLNPPARLDPGQTWQQVQRVTVPARVFGSVTWRVDVSAGTRTDRAVQTVQQKPSILIAIVLVLVADLGILATRWRIRRRKGLEQTAGSVSAPTAGGPPFDASALL